MSIGGQLDQTAMARLHFTTLAQSEQEAAIRRMAVSGQGPHTIAHATGWTLEEVLRVLAEGHLQ